ncbi:hypothetical protein BaRGS_00038350 [Batillaria attramentaria]|uniref:Uncharacterized protein n=1 Tax=Batillaria attramentaria TaxID=370345 RepID=A0ABD0J6M7_9CAEN
MRRASALVGFVTLMPPGQVIFPGQYLCDRSFNVNHRLSIGHAMSTKGRIKKSILAGSQLEHWHAKGYTRRLRPFSIQYSTAERIADPYAGVVDRDRSLKAAAEF